MNNIKLVEAHINVRIKGPMVTFLDYMTGPQGLYENQNEYIRDLIRSDMELRGPDPFDDEEMEDVED